MPGNIGGAGLNRARAIVVIDSTDRNGSLPLIHDRKGDTPANFPARVDAVSYISTREECTSSAGDGDDTKARRRRRTNHADRPQRTS